MNAVTKVLIIGGGIGGQSAAIAFAKRGVNVEIVEIQPAFNVYGVGIIQQANALKALDKIGIADEAMKRGLPYGQVKMYAGPGNHFIGLAGPPPTEKYPSHNGISRRTLHEIMYEETQKLGVPYKMGTSVKAFENNEDNVSVTFSDGTKDTYDIVVASDGIRSKTREMVFGSHLQPKYMGLSVWRYAFPRHEDLDTGYMYYGKRSKIGFIPMSEDTMYMFLVSMEGQEWIGESQFIPMLQDYLSEYPVKIAQDASEQITDPNLVNYRNLEAVRIPDKWYKNRIVIIGDGAHATVPQLGSGAALAIEDAVVLAEELDKVDDVQEGFQNFMERRYKRAIAVVDASEKLAEWEVLEFSGKPLPEDANVGKLIGQTIGLLMQPF